MSARCRAAIAAIVVCLAFPGAASAAALDVTGLRVDNRTDELLGVGEQTPVLGWRVTGSGPAAAQTAFQVRVAGSAEALASGPYLWDSGRVDSREQSAEYAGAALASRGRVAWQVRVWDASGESSAWSAPARFELGLLAPADWGAAKWIQLPAPAANRPVDTRARRAGRALRAPGRDQARPAGHRGRARARVAPAAGRARAGGLLRGRRQPRPGRDGHGVEPVRGRGLEPRRARRRGAHHARLHEPRVQDPAREPIVLGPARPRRGAPLRPAAAVPAHGSADGGRQGAELPGRLHPAGLRDRPRRARHDRDRDRSGDAARTRHPDGAADLRARLHG